MTDGAERLPRPKEVPVTRAETIDAAESATGKRKQKSFYLTTDVLERLNGCVYWARAGFLSATQAGEDIDPSELPDSAASLVERALWTEVLRQEKLFNNGEPFPPAPGRLATGPGAAGAQRLRRPRAGREPESGGED